jgi:prolyl-tRNA synthetase
METLNKTMIKKKEQKTENVEKSKNNLGLTAEKDDFSEWFTQLMLKADLADYTEVSGCIVFKPNSYELWEKIQRQVDDRFKKIGIRNAYFPLLIPEKFLAKEKEHVKDFNPLVAWVTQSGNTPMQERLAIRPTSETIMYPSYAKWIRSWRDLPLKINQWNNVVRWEFSHPVPFFRTREFLWNELHTVLETEKDAMDEGKQILGIYKDVCENYLALYGVIGRKTEREKFAGAIASTKLHYILANGKVIEGPCFHYDGQNFSKAYDIKFLDKNEKEQYPFQCTYAISTRMLGTMFAMHSDDKGLIIPPKIAINAIVIIPILFDKTKEKVLKVAKDVEKRLERFSPLLDARENYTPGFKFNDYELKGIPLRIEIGPKDIENNQVMLVRRDNLEKKAVKLQDIEKEVTATLADLQEKLFQKSKKLFQSKIEKANSLDKLKEIIEAKKVGIVPMCKNPDCEDLMKAETKGAKAVFITEDKVKVEKCIICNKKADYFVLTGKTY